jgi:hypothetical protein
MPTKILKPTNNQVQGHRKTFNVSRHHIMYENKNSFLLKKKKIYLHFSSVACVWISNSEKCSGNVYADDDGTNDKCLAIFQFNLAVFDIDYIGHSCNNTHALSLNYNDKIFYFCFGSFSLFFVFYFNLFCFTNDSLSLLTFPFRLSFCLSFLARSHSLTICFVYISLRF